MTSNLMKGIALIMFGCGLALNLTSNIHTLRLVGNSLMVIAFLWHSYLRLRAAEPDQQRINQHLFAAEKAPLGIGTTFGQAGSDNPIYQPVSRDVKHLTPVERLLADDEQQ